MNINIPHLHSFHTAKGGIVGVIVNPSGSVEIDRLNTVLSLAQRRHIAINIALRYHGSHTVEFEQLCESIVSALGGSQC